MRAASAWDGVRCIFWRDLRIALRRRSDSVAAIVFFVIVTSLFPLAIGAEPALLRRIAPGVVWVAALLAAMLSLGRLYADDDRDGTLEQLLLSPTPLPLLIGAKMAAHWLCSGALLAVVAPLLALQFDLPADAMGALVASLLLGTPLLSLVGGIGAALTVGVRGAGVLLSLVVLPLVTPVLIFGLPPSMRAWPATAPRPSIHCWPHCSSSPGSWRRGRGRRPCASRWISALRTIGINVRPFGNLFFPGSSFRPSSAGVFAAALAFSAALLSAWPIASLAADEACAAEMSVPVEDRLVPVLHALDRARHQHGMWSPDDAAAFAALLGADDAASSEARVALMDYYLGERQGEALTCAVAKDGERSTPWLAHYATCDIAPQRLPLPRDHAAPWRERARALIAAGDVAGRCAPK